MKFTLKEGACLALVFFCSIACDQGSHEINNDSNDQIINRFSEDEGLLEEIRSDQGEDRGDVDFGVTADMQIITDATSLTDISLPWISPPEGSIVIDPEPQREGDPEQGYDHFINSPFVGCGIPLSVFDRVGDPSRFFPLVGLPAEEAYLEGRVGGNADLPYFLTYNRTKSDVEIAATNCMSCHAGLFQEQLFVGLGNSTINTTNDVSIFANGLGRLIDDPTEREAWAYWAERMSAVAPEILLDTKGVVAADNLAIVLFGRRDPSSLEWRDDYQINVTDEVPIVPLAIPPLWRMGKKSAMFYSGSFRGDHSRYMFAASSLCLTDLEEFHEIDSYFNHVRAWIASLEPPIWPYELDSIKATRGEVIFERSCSSCHGTYGDAPTYPNLVIPEMAIGTDPLLLVLEQLFVDSLGPWFEQTPLTESNYLIATGGYMAPPLDGIWITAPYLHNDSVPSLATLLDSSRRPSYWRRTSYDSNDFDPVEVGWRYEERDVGRDEGAGPEVYDATRLGYLNEGHTYGDHLSSEERVDLIEYLKTL